jgi:hypothetical protein
VNILEEDVQSAVQELRLKKKKNLYNSWVKYFKSLKKKSVRIEDAYKKCVGYSNPSKEVRLEIMQAAASVGYITERIRREGIRERCFIFVG